MSLRGAVCGRHLRPRFADFPANVTLISDRKTVPSGLSGEFRGLTFIPPAQRRRLFIEPVVLPGHLVGAGVAVAQPDHCREQKRVNQVAAQAEELGLIKGEMQEARSSPCSQPAMLHIIYKRGSTIKAFNGAKRDTKQISLVSAAWQTLLKPALHFSVESALSFVTMTRNCSSLRDCIRRSTGWTIAGSSGVCLACHGARSASVIGHFSVSAGSDCNLICAG